MKRPYFIHFRDNKSTTEMGEVEGLEKEGEEGAERASSKIDSDVVNGRMLTMAGLFDICATERPEVSPSWHHVGWELCKRRS